MLYRKLMMALCLATASIAAAQTQTAKPAPAPAAGKTTPATTAASAATQEGGAPTYLRPETPEQRKARLGTTEDPGPNPDPEKHFWRFGKSQHIERYERKWAVYDGPDETLIRPFGYVNSYRELYQHNERYVWVWADDPKPEDQHQATSEQVSPTGERYSQFAEEDVTFFQNIRNEFSELTPVTSKKVIRFEESSEGLPTVGSWRNSLAVADMNEDGFLDLIAPPERAGNAAPVIFLGDGKGHWKPWVEAKWPHGLDYGSVAAGDFNKDGHMDLAFGVHLNGVYVYLGDGKGNFTESSTGLQHDFPTRRVVVADADHDGYPDVIAISEGPTAVQRPADANYARMRVFLNRRKGMEWEAMNVADPISRFGGDWLTVGNFNRDEYPDFAGASIFFNGVDTIWMSNGAKKWRPVANKPNAYAVPYVSYYFASTAGHFVSKNVDDLIVSYVRFWPTNLNPKTVPEPPSKQVSGIDRITFGPNGEAKRVSIARWADRRGVAGVASGDFDGDGNLDIMYQRYDPRELVILLGDGNGGFTRATVEGVHLEPNASYDVKVADVNNDKRPDVILMYESSGKSAFAARDGSIHVFLGRGATTAPAAKPANSTK